MTAYQPVGDYATTGELDTASSFLSGAIDYVSGSFTGKQDNLSFEYTVADTISSINESAINPTPIFTDSATMSGYGTEVSPFGVKTTTLFVQNPLFSGISGTSAYIGRNNETILYTGSTQDTATLNEDITHFEWVKVSWGIGQGKMTNEFDVEQISGGTVCPLTMGPSFSNGYASIYTQSWYFPNTTSFASAQIAKELWGKDGLMSARDATAHSVYKIVGINRRI